MLGLLNGLVGLHAEGKVIVATIGDDSAVQDSFELRNIADFYTDQP